jgi:cellulose synthase/poly-beta-1,6-N-acetylglucosamine synthase-like glycosyltransferase
MIYIVEVILFIGLGLMVSYLFFFSFSAKFLSCPKIEVDDLSEECQSRIAILVPSYKEDSIIISTALSLTRLKYPTELFDIYIIADSLQDDTLCSLRKLPVNVIPVQFEKSTKSRALNVAMEQIQVQYDLALVCDADNILHPDFLRYINTAFCLGYQAIQGQRVAKNMDSRFSILDGASEMINNHIFRKGHCAVSLSSSIIGSGMAFSYPLLKQIMQEIDAVGGFDKVLQLEIARRDIPIIYIDNSSVFDEKISHATAFGTQRNRWISSQFIYFRMFFFPGWRMLLRGNINFFNLAIMHNILLPRIILLGLLPLLLLVSIVLKNLLLIGPLGWTILCLFYFTALLIALPTTFFRRQFLSALMSVPTAFFIMVKSLFHIRSSNQTFIHTVHNKEEITNSIYKTDGI